MPKEYMSWHSINCNEAALLARELTVLKHEGGFVHGEATRLLGHSGGPVILREEYVYDGSRWPESDCDHKVNDAGMAELRVLLPQSGFRRLLSKLSRR